MNDYGLENEFTLDILCTEGAGALTLCCMVNRGGPHSPERMPNHTTNLVSGQRDLHRPARAYVMLNVSLRQTVNV